MGIKSPNLLGIGVLKRVRNNFDLQFLTVSGVCLVLAIFTASIGYVHTVEKVEKTVQTVRVPLANGGSSPQKALLIETYQERPFLLSALSLGFNAIVVGTIFGLIAFNQKSPREYRKKLKEANAYVDDLKKSEDELSLADLTDFYSYKESYFPESDESDPDLILSFYEIKNLEVAHQEVYQSEPLPVKTKKKKEPAVIQSSTPAVPQSLPSFTNPTKLKERKTPKTIEHQSVSEENDSGESLINPRVTRADDVLDKIGKAIEEKNNSINKKNPIKFSGQVLKSGVLHRFFFVIPQETDIGSLLKINPENFNYIVKPHREKYSRVAINPGTIYHDGRAYFGFDLFLQCPERVSAEKILEPRYSDSINWNILVGLNELNEPITVDLSKNYNGLFAGIPGSGKSRTAMGAVFSLFFTNTPEQLRLIVIDGKHAWSSWNKKDNGEWLPWLELPVITTEDAEEVESAFEFLREIIKKRGKFGHDDLKTWNEKHPEDQQPMYMLLIDEYSKCVQDFNNQGYDFEANVESLISLGRSAGVRVIISNQLFSSENSSQSIRNLPDWKVCLKVNNSRCYKQIFDLANLSVISEPGHFYWISGEESYPQFGHSLWIEQEPLLTRLGIDLPPEVFGVPTQKQQTAEQLSLLIESDEEAEDEIKNISEDDSEDVELDVSEESLEENDDFWNN